MFQYYAKVGTVVYQVGQPRPSKQRAKQSAATVALSVIG